jgi:ectoine hydroxylase-related dioxygenase (phytanoyl-CoA dioxygenase family)
MPLQPGGAGLHMGRTLHYSRGNTTGTNRRAYILNFRPRAMIEYERAQGFTHGREGHKTHAVRSTQ